MYETPVSRSVYKNTVERILIVDPETVDRQLVSMALLEEAPGLNITEAQNLMQGAASLAHGACDVVVAHWPQGTSWSSLYKDAAPRIKRLPWVVLTTLVPRCHVAKPLAGWMRSPSLDTTFCPNICDPMTSALFNQRVNPAAF